MKTLLESHCPYITVVIQKLSSKVTTISITNPNHKALLGSLSQQIQPGLLRKQFITSRIFCCNWKEKCLIFFFLFGKNLSNVNFSNFICDSLQNYFLLYCCEKSNGALAEYIIPVVPKSILYVPGCLRSLWATWPPAPAPLAAPQEPSSAVSWVGCASSPTEARAGQGPKCADKPHHGQVKEHSKPSKEFGFL